jgi:DNA-binding response OmpR family regulator
MKPGKRILVVDDDESYRAILRHHLETLGYEVLEAEDGIQAIRLTSRGPLQLMILDIVMPHTEGLETISLLRRAGVRTKILAVSGAGQGSEYLEVAVKMGADAKIEKIRPVSELLKLVERLTGETHTVAGASPR